MSAEFVDWQDGDLTVVVNDEEQYSIWPADRPLPAGWREAGYAGKKAECLDFIKRVWVDMRPLSLRKLLEDVGRTDTEPPVAEVAEPDDDSQDLVSFLSAGDHPVEVVVRNRGVPWQELKAGLDRGFLLIKFTDTRGGTEIGVRLDPAACKPAAASLAEGSGSVHLEGTLTLDYTPVRCVADVKLDTLEGSGRLFRQ